jgi:hypothetical protein
MVTQQQHFERRVADLREFRNAERLAVQNLERLANEGCTEAEWNEAEAHHAMLLGAVKMAAAELALVYYE